MPERAAIARAEDSQVTWEAASGVRPIFDCGRLVTDWVRQADGLWKAAVPEERAGIGTWDCEHL